MTDATDGTVEPPIQPAEKTRQQRGAGAAAQLRDGAAGIYRSGYDSRLDPGQTM